MARRRPVRSSTVAPMEASSAARGVMRPIVAHAVGYPGAPRGARSPRPPSAARPPFDGNVSGAPTPRRYHGHAMLRRIDVRGRGLADIEIPRPRVAEEPPVAAVRDIIASVRAGGDGALRALTARLDGATIEALRVPPEACEAALAALPAALRA